MLADLPRACDVGSKRNAKGHTTLLDRLWTPPVMQAVSLIGSVACGQVLSSIRPVGATCWTPLACMGDTRERVQIGYASLRAPIQGAGFPDPVSFDRLPLPVLRPSRIPDGFPRFALSGDAGSPVVLLLRRQRPGDARHSVGQRNCNEHPRLARQHTGQPRVRRLATSGGVPYDRHRARDQKPPEVALAHLGYLAQPGLAAGRVLPWERARAMRRSRARARKLSIGGAKACSAIAVIGPTPGIVMRRTASSSWRALVCTSFSNPRIFSSRPAICSSRRPPSSRTCSGSPEHGSSSAEAKRLT